VESTAAILLHKRKFSEASLVVSCGGRNHLAAYKSSHRRARRLKSPFTGKLDLFLEAEISVVRGRESDLHSHLG
jgi:hypothetical protein